jgi:ribonuclease HI/uncharacterized phage-like protein YoqJ
MAERTIVYTDGACSGNPGPGGWAWVVPDGPYSSGAEPHTTNQRMELMAALDALRNIEGPLHVISDSTYVVNCFRDRWWEGWIRRGWVNSQKKPVANRDLWEPFVDLYQDRDVTFEWVKGHSGNEWNDMADRLAVEASQSQNRRSGGERPTELGPADSPGPSRTRSGPNIDGHRLLITGLRPKELGGYGETFQTSAVRTRLARIIDAKAQLHPDLVVISGMGLGTDTLAAEAADQAGVPYVAILPYPESDAQWPADTRKHFAGLLAGAADTITLEKKTPDTKQKVGGSLRRREAWLARNADEAVVVWDGQEPFVGRSIRSLQDALGEESVWVVDINELS